MTWFRVHGGGGGEDVSEEVAVQTPLIQQIREMIVGKATDANATEDKIVKGYSAYVGQKLVNGNLEPSYGGMMYRKLGEDSRPIDVLFKFHQVSPFVSSDGQGNRYPAFPAADTFKNLEYAEFDFEDEIMPVLFARCFSGLTKPAKFKFTRNVKKLNYEAFTASKTTGGKIKIFIPSSVEYIDGGQNTYVTFQGCNNLDFYCEAESKPSNWGQYWNRDANSASGKAFPVTWGVTEEEFDSM